MSREHSWAYGGDDPADADYRSCTQCRLHQWTVARGNWDDPEWVLWRMQDGSRWLEGTAPECPDPPPPEAGWVAGRGQAPAVGDQEPERRRQGLPVHRCGDQGVRAQARGRAAAGGAAAAAGGGVGSAR